MPGMARLGRILTNWQNAQSLVSDEQHREHDLKCVGRPSLLLRTDGRLLDPELYSVFEHYVPGITSHILRKNITACYPLRAPSIS